MAWGEKTWDEERFEGVKDLAIRASALSMGFVFVSAGWRRFVNAPAKLDIESAKSVANKLVEAAPGSPLEGVIHWLLASPSLAGPAVYLMTTGEVLAGLGLIFGAFTRLAAAGAAALNIALMLIFGWQGYECLDEWTMSALGFAISVSVMLYGPGSFSFDSAVGIDPFRRLFTRKVAVGLTVFSIVFTVAFYAYFFGIAELKRRTSVSTYSIVAEKVEGETGAATLYVNAGGSPTSSYVKSITFTLEDGSEVTQEAGDIDVLKSHFEPWSQSGKVVDGVLKLRLGSKTDIRLPEGAVSATIDLIDNPDQTVSFR
ncbi:TQO small subunit DoxD [Methyloligella sp. 2.7D]|uniref:TQO small subunit DoxD n=1 Tax=unclassified Methyloligella TaxID=2625955 RepID=UPI00157DF762|nr:TQO small subunit DoxD [Methyloligella sp. GL2]QKP76332.1 DoxX family membrane protein [Methyloligella sp. GL2]